MQFYFASAAPLREFGKSGWQGRDLLRKADFSETLIIRFWPKADNLLAVMNFHFRSKADMAFCSANVSY